MSEYKWKNQDEWLEYISSNLERTMILNSERLIHIEKMENRIKKINKIKSKLI